jgi:flagellar motor switch protein FliN
MPPITQGTPLHSFLETLRKATSEVFSQAFGTSWSVEVDASDIVNAATTPVLSFQLSISGGLLGNLSVQLSTPDALLLAQTFLAESIDPNAELKQDHKDALEELLRQVAGPTATALKSSFGETKLDVASVEPPTWEGLNVALLASANSPAKVTLQLRLSPELLASVSATKPAAAESQTPTLPSQGMVPVISNEPNFDLLLGVDLNLTLRFGQRVLPLREILDLNAGSVIELDREVQEPADLLLGDRIIARGEVVIVDGNYGLRITEVTDVPQGIAAH